VTFKSGFQFYPWLQAALRVRDNPILAYGFALVMIVVAVLARWLVGEYVGARIPFITFYPAIILATLIGGLWPGIFATVLSTLAAWFLFVSPYFSFALGEREAVQVSLFVIVASINVIIVAMLDALVGRLIVQHRNIQVLFESSPNGFVLVDEAGTIKLVNASTEKLFGYSRNELVGKDVEFLVPESHVGPHRKVRAAYQQKPEARAMGAGRDLTARRKDGTEFPIEIGLNPLADHDGPPVVLATVLDISARKQVQENERLVMRELQHRTKNLFSVFQAIASRSLEDAKTPAQAKFVLNGRIQALSHAYSALAENAWTGASLAVILDQQFSNFGPRVAVSGCDIVLRPSATNQLALITHELMTNALKYGALSVPDGKISIEGTSTKLNGSGTFSFVWKEIGGPRVTEPSRQGFGSVILIETAKQLAQRVELDFAPQGIRYAIQFVLSEIETSPFVSPTAAAQFQPALGELA
jgi:PAS domain S-box-containing protein